MANYETAVCATLVAYFLEKYSSGRRGAPAKGVGRVTGAEVQIFSSPPKRQRYIFVSLSFSFCRRRIWTLQWRLPGAEAVPIPAPCG